MRHSWTHTSLQPDRRSFLLGTAGTLAAGLSAPLARPSINEADAAPLPPPRPIPGGLDLPPLVHVFLPGPETITLPFSGLTLQGLDVEASTITDFNGVTALAYVVGTASGNDGSSYNLEADVRVFEGEYVGADGSPRAGTFALM
jgi:hypothetical protein